MIKFQKVKFQKGRIWIFVANKKGTPEMQLMTLWFLHHSSVNVSIWSLKLYDLMGTTQITGFLVETFKATNKSFRWRSCQYKNISSCIQLKVSFSSPSNVKHYFVFYFLHWKKLRRTISPLLFWFVLNNPFNI